MTSLMTTLNKKPTKDKKIYLPPCRNMSNYLHLLLFQRLQNCMANNSHFRVLLPLVLRLESELLKSETLRKILVHYLRLRLLIHDLQSRILLRESIGFLFVETPPRVMLCYPRGKLASVMVIINWNKILKFLSLLHKSDQYWGQVVSKDGTSSA